MGCLRCPGAVNEWYPHNMYRPGDPAHDDFVQRFGGLESRGYKDFIPVSVPKIRSQDWVKLFKQAGAKYVVPIAEHHDGFAMYDSDLSDWTVVKMGLDAMCWRSYRQPFVEPGCTLGSPRIAPNTTTTRRGPFDPFRCQ